MKKSGGELTLKTSWPADLNEEKQLQVQSIPDTSALIISKKLQLPSILKMNLQKNLQYKSSTGRIVMSRPSIIISSTGGIVMPRLSIIIFFNNYLASVMLMYPMPFTSCPFSSI